MKETVIIFLFALTIIFQIIFYHLSPDISLPIFLLTITLIFFIKTRNKVIFFPKTFLIIFLLFIFFSCISLYYSPTKFSSFLEVIKYFSLFLFVILEINILKSEKNFLKIIFFILMLAGAFWGLSGILEYSSRIRQLKFLLLSEPFHWNSLAASFFLLIYPFIFTSFIEEEKRGVKKILLFICLFLIVGAWLLTRFSIFWLFFLTFGGIIISFLNEASPPVEGRGFLFQRKGSRFAGKAAFLASFIPAFGKAGYSEARNKNLKNSLFLKQKLGEFFILILLLGATLPNINASFGSKIPPSSIGSFQEKFIFRERGDIWRFSSETIPNNFWWGIGPGNFEAAYRLGVIKPWTWAGFSLNEPLQTFTEQGIGSFLTQCLFFFYLLALAFKKNLKSIKKKKLGEWEISTSVIAFLITNLVCLPAIRIFPLAIIFLIEISFLLLEERMVKIKFPSIRWMVMLSLFLSLFFFTDSFLLQTSQRYFLKGKYKESERILNWLTKRPTYFLNPRSLIWLSACKLEKKEEQQAIFFLKRAQMLDPYNQDIPYEIASHFYRQGELNRALETLEKEITKNPFCHPKYYYSLGMIYLEKQNSNLALHYFGEGEKIFSFSSQPNPPFTLFFLESQKYSLYLREIYLQLYHLTKDKNWLIKLTFLL